MKQRGCLVAHGHCAYVRTAEPPDSQCVATVSVQAYSCYWETTWGGRSSQGQVSLVSPMTQGGRRAHGTIQPTNNHQRAGYRPERNTPPVPGSGTRRPGGPGPILVLPRQRDDRYMRGLEKFLFQCHESHDHDTYKPLRVNLIKFSDWTAS